MLVYQRVFLPGEISGIFVRALGFEMPCIRGSIGLLQDLARHFEPVVVKYRSQIAVVHLSFYPRIKMAWFKMLDALPSNIKKQCRIAKRLI